MIINMTIVADPAASGIDLNKKSVPNPLKLPIAASIAHLRCLRSIASLPFDLNHPSCSARDSNPRVKFGQSEYNSD
jgi:hypothetical protein